MIRSILTVALFAAAASPAFAFSTQPIAAPHDSSHHFAGMTAVAHMLPETTTAAPDRPAPQARGNMIVYELPKGKPAAEIDINSPRDNPFMARPLK